MCRPLNNTQCSASDALSNCIKMRAKQQRPSLKDHSGPMVPAIFLHSMTTKYPEVTRSKFGYKFSQTTRLTEHSRPNEAMQNLTTTYPHGHNPTNKFRKWLPAQCSKTQGSSPAKCQYFTYLESLKVGRR